MHTPSPIHHATSRRSRIRRAVAGVSLGLLLGPLAIAGPVNAQTSDRSDRTTTTVDQAERQRPQADRPDRERPHRDLEVLQMKCSVADGEPEDTRVHIGCRWRAAEQEKAAGYQLWRIVDRGEREMVARGGLDMLGARDVVSAEASVVRYAVIAVDENGRRVGQSRVQKLVLADDDPTDGTRRARFSAGNAKR